MPPIVLELQRFAADDKVSVSNLLRRALIVATKLDIPDFIVWIQREDSGYQSVDVSQLPEYRRLRAEVKAKNPYHGWIPVVIENPEEAEALSDAPCATAVSELEALLEESVGPLHVAFDGQTTMELMRSADLPIPPVRIISKAQVKHLLDSIRNHILKWALELERNGILGMDMSFTEEERRRAKHDIHIENFTGVLGNVSSSQLQFGDYGSIHTELKKAGISQADRNELENILDEYRVSSGPEKAGLAKRGMAWVTKHGAQIAALSETIRAWFQSS